MIARLILGFFVLLVAPLLVRGAIYALSEKQPHWSTAPRAATGIAPDPAIEKQAVIQIYAARAYRWRGIFAVHTWLAYKRKDGSRYERYDVMGWFRNPLVHNFGPADGSWYGITPTVIYDLRGEAAEVLIPKLEATIADYPHQQPGDYVLMPGPNSNSFIADIARRLPEMQLTMPPGAVGKDFSPSWLSIIPTPSNTGYQLSFNGYGGFALGLVEGIELHIAGTTLGVDILRPALKVPGLGRLGLPARLN